MWVENQSALALVGLYAGIWLGFHVGAGYLAYRLPLAWLDKIPWVCRSYRWERGGRVYQRLHIGAWKERLPEAGGLFPGGFSKRRLQTTSPAYLQRFAREVCRAECSHWLTWGLALTFFAWNPWPIGVVMVIYGGLSNLPFILVQRYNRARLARLERALAARAHRD